MAETLKRGSPGDLVRRPHGGRAAAVREFGTARFGCRWLARRLARREARALERLEGLDGEVMHRARPESRVYFRDALRLVRQIHRRGVAHNDLAKEANWICRRGQAAGIVDFQLAYCPARLWRAAFKPVYRLLTRGLLGWPERPGPAERERLG